ncbi:hypothetical protein [Sulfurimonas sp. HSL3-2]
MKKKSLFIMLSMILVSMSFTACSSFKETYKPLYQVKPTVEKVEEK